MYCSFVLTTLQNLEPQASADFCSLVEGPIQVLRTSGPRYQCPQPAMCLGRVCTWARAPWQSSVDNSSLICWPQCVVTNFLISTACPSVKRLGGTVLWNANQHQHYYNAEYPRSAQEVWLILLPHRLRSVFLSQTTRVTHGWLLYHLHTPNNTYCSTVYFD